MDKNSTSSYYGKDEYDLSLSSDSQSINSISTKSLEEEPAATQPKPISSDANEPAQAESYASGPHIEAASPHSSILNSNKHDDQPAVVGLIPDSHYVEDVSPQITQPAATTPINADDDSGSAAPGVSANRKSSMHSRTPSTSMESDGTSSTEVVQSQDDGNSQNGQPQPVIPQPVPAKSQPDDESQNKTESEEEDEPKTDEPSDDNAEPAIEKKSKPKKSIEWNGIKKVEKVTKKLEKLLKDKENSDSGNLHDIIEKMKSFNDQFKEIKETCSDTLNDGIMDEKKQKAIDGYKAKFKGLKAEFEGLKFDKEFPKYEKNIADGLERLKRLIDEQVEKTERTVNAYSEFAKCVGVLETNRVLSKLSEPSGMNMETKLTILRNKESAVTKEAKAVYGENFKLDIKNENEVKTLLNNFGIDVVNFGKLKEAFKEGNSKEEIEQKLQNLRELNAPVDMEKFMKKNIKGGQLYTNLPRIKNFEYKKRRALSLDSNTIKGDFVYNEEGSSCKIEFKINSDLGNFYVNHATYGCSLLMNILAEHNWEIEKCGLRIGNTEIKDWQQLKSTLSGDKKLTESLTGGCSLEAFEEKFQKRKQNMETDMPTTLVIGKNQGRGRE